MSLAISKKPRRFRLSNIRADLGKLFTNLTHTAAQVAAAGMMGDYTKAAQGIARAASGIGEAFSHETQPEDLAWFLVRDSLARALGELIAESLPGIKPREGDADYLDKKIALAISQGDVEISPLFFQNPAALPLIARVEDIFADWLDRYYDLRTTDAQAMSRRLRSYFAVALHDEWRANTSKYRGLADAFAGPFAKAATLEQEWDRYRLNLIRQFDRPVFEETFPLSAIYVPLRAARALPRKAAAGPTRAQRASEAVSLHLGEDGATTREILDLHSGVSEWLESANKDDAIRLVRGGPGSGKSTFARMLAADLSAQDNLRVLFFPLQHFELRDQIKAAIGDALGSDRAQAFTSNPLEQTDFATPQRRLLLIFDGLDELAQPGREADRQTGDFLTNLRFEINAWNQAGCRVFALITGRSPVVQANRSTLGMTEQQELEVLPFFMPKEAHASLRDRFHDPKKLRDVDQRQDWWKRYVACKADQPQIMPERLMNQDVAELTAEPLLLYLLVLSRFHLEQRDGDTPYNRNRVYASLFTNVVERRHAGGQAAAAVTQIGADDFAQVMEAVATAAWYGDGRTASADDIRRCCPVILKKKLEEFLSSDVGIARLIAAFYFQQTEGATRRRDAIEFTHKSFGEYLTARRLVRVVQEIDVELRRVSSRWQEAQALTEWYELTCRTAMEGNLLRFIRDEVALWSKPEVASWQESLIRLFNWNLIHGMPVTLSSELSFRTGERMARNAEETLLAMLSACARVTDQITRLSWPSPGAAGNLLLRMEAFADQRVIGSIARQCLDRLDLGGQWLIGTNLIEADLTRSILRDARLPLASFYLANLTETDLTNARLNDTNLDNVRAHSAIFRGAQMLGCRGRGGTFDNADFTDAMVNEFTFHNASTIGAKGLSKPRKRKPAAEAT